MHDAQLIKQHLSGRWANNNEKTTHFTSGPFFNGIGYTRRGRITF